MITRTNLNNVQETGRLGNQMWAIASAIGIALSNKDHYVFPEWGYQRWFKNELPSGIDLSFYNSRNSIREYKEPTPYWTPAILNKTYLWDLKGYFQSYKYFDTHKDLLQHYFKNFTYDIPEWRNYKGYVGVHIRRGDYLGLQHIHPILGIDYYYPAMQFMTEVLGSDTKFVIFTDDPIWCKENFNNVQICSGEQADIVEWTYLANCSHFIIANSSYSWWAAYLADSGIIVAPKTWVLNEDKDDRVPEEWVRL